MAGVVVEEPDGFERIHSGAEAPVAQRAPVHGLHAFKTILVDVGQGVSVVQLLQLVSWIHADCETARVRVDGTRHSGAAAVTWYNVPQQVFARDVDDATVGQVARRLRSVLCATACAREVRSDGKRTTSVRAAARIRLRVHGRATYIGGSPEHADGAPAELVPDGVIGCLGSRQASAQRHEARDFSSPALQTLDQTQR